MTKWWNHRTAAFLMLTMALGACSGDPSSPDATWQATAASASSERADTSWDASPENDEGDADSTLLASPDANSRHYALVLGNSQYRHGDALPAASKDAALMASALRGRGYHVLLARDRTLAQMREDIDAFSDLSARADVRVIYFAGHGFEFGHDNYLMPVDLPSAIHDLDETLIRQSALRLQDVAWPLEQEQGVLIAIVDACRIGPSRGAAAI